MKGRGKMSRRKRSVRKVRQKTARGATKKAAKKSAKNAVRRTARKAVKKAVKKSVKKAARKSVRLERRRQPHAHGTGVAMLEPPAPPARPGAQPRRADAELPGELWKAKALAVAEFLEPSSGAAIPSLRAIDPDPRVNVVGVGVGHPRDWARRGGTPVIRFYVLARLPDTAIAPRHRLPSSIGGVPTEVVEAGPFLAHRAGRIDPKQRLRPAHPGNSISFVHTGAEAGYRSAGTLGAVIQVDGRRGILSNNHVLANENRLPVGSPILQPGTRDGGLPAGDVIARLTRFVPLTTTATNRLDAAYALALDDQELEPTVPPPIGRLAGPDPIPAARAAMVAKFGRTTLYTEGKITEISADVYMRYDSGRLRFTEQIFIEGATGAFSEPGDSGSLVVDLETRRPVALLIGGEPRRSIATPIARVLAELEVELEV